MKNDDIDYDAIRKRVEQRMKDRMGFIMDLVSFVGVNGLLWLIWLPGRGFPWPLFITIPWGIGLFAHAANTLFSGTMNKMAEREVEQEIERERMRRGMSTGKRKNELDTPMRLSDEGELIPDDEAESPRSARSNRR
ncbi:MAG TPA: 2TM domain-containing protein [Aggregatilineales bacterium]|nr:2TM domain-containing protein [Aggregatilineales bacterium]